MSVNDWDIEVEKVVAVDQLDAVAVRPFSRACVLPQRLQFTEAAGVPRTDYADVYLANNERLRPVCVAKDAVAADLLNRGGGGVL